MRRLTIFAKGNSDVRDSLVVAAQGEAKVWNGINEIMRERFPEVVVRVQHETYARSDALLGCAGSVPEELSARKWDLGPFKLTSQFSRGLFQFPCDAVVLSIQPDIMNPLFRRRGADYLWYCPFPHRWSAEDRRWLHEKFESVGLIELASFQEHLEAICKEIRSSREVPILIYNMSSTVPGDRVHRHDETGEILSTRIRRFNLALIDLSQKLGISVVDVDAILARAGADRLKRDAHHLTAEGSRVVAEEVVRILGDWNLLDGAEQTGIV